jgi:hypothetical protein
MPSYQYWSSVAVNSVGRFVAVSQSDVAAYSDNGIDWVSPPLPSYQNWASVTVNSTGRFVAISRSDVTVYSNDGIHWSVYGPAGGNVTTQNLRVYDTANIGNVNATNFVAYRAPIMAIMPLNRSWYSVTVNSAGRFVAVSYSGNGAAYSDDGITWVQTYLPSNQYWSSVTVNSAGRFVAVSYSDIAAYSDDGIAWTRVPIPSYQYWTSVTVNSAGRFVAVSQYIDTAAYSDNGIDWVQTYMQSYQSWSSVTVNSAGRFVAISSGDVAAYSDNGIDWVQTYMPSNQYWIPVTVNSTGRFVAISQSDVGAYSDNGIDWVQTYMPSYQSWYSVAVNSAGRFVAVSYDYSDVSAYSDDGINWVQTSMPSNQYWRSVTVNSAGRFVAVCESDVVVYSDDGIHWSVYGPAGGNVTTQTLNVYDTATIGNVTTQTLNVYDTATIENVYVSNSVTTTNVFATRYYGDGGLLSNITSFIQPLANLVVSNSVTTTNVFAANVNVNDTFGVLGSMTANAANATFFFDTFTIPYINTQYMNVASSITAPLANIATMNVDYLTVNSAVVYGTNTLNVYGTSNLTNVFATNYYGDGGLLSNVATQPFANLVVSNAVTATNLFASNTLSVGPGTLGSNVVVFSNISGGSNTFVMDSNGRVTIGSTYTGGSLLSFGQQIANKVITMYDNNNADNPFNATNFYGFGRNTNLLRYQVNDTGAAHTFFGGTTEYARITSTGVSILTGANPTSNLQVTGNAYISNSVTTTNVFAVTATVPGFTSQFTVSGGGTVTWSAGNLLWSARVIVIPAWRNAAYATNGYWDITCPTSGTIVSNGGTVTCTAAGVPVGGFGALYYRVVPGTGNALVQANFILKDYNDTTYSPDSNWILLALRNGNTSEIKWMPGNTTIPLGGTFYTPSASFDKVQVAGTVVVDSTRSASFLNVFSSNSVTTTNVFANTLTMSNATSTINVTGNIFASNAVTTTDLFTAGITSNVTSTVFNSDTLTIPFVYSTTLNVASTSNLDTVTLTGEPGLTTLFASGNAYVSNAVTTTNLFANTLTMSNATSTINVTGNLFVSNAVTTTNVFANTSTLTGRTGATTLNVTGNLFVSNAVTTTNVIATTVTTTNPIPFRNRLINGGMTLWQRNVASISTTTSIYTTADRWCGALGTSGLILSQWPGPIENLQFPYSLQVTTSTTTSGTPLVEQRIENQNIPDFLNGTPVTVSFWAGQSYGTLMPLTVGLYYATAVNNFGTQTLAVAAAQNTPTLTAANVYYSLSFTLTTGAAATNGLSLRFTTGGASAVGSTVLLTGVQVEKGLVATPFEVRPYATELALAQRYYYQLTSPTAAVLGAAQVYSIFGTATGITTTAFWLPIQFPVTMRTPNYTFSNSAVTNFQLLPTGTTTITSVGVQTDSYTPIGATLNFVGTNLTAGSSYIFRTNGLTGSTVAFFGFSSEL